MTNTQALPNHHATALDHIAAVQTYSDNLREEWAKTRPDHGEVKYLSATLGRSLKLAEIHATLAIGAQLERIGDHLDHQALEHVVTLFSGDMPPLPPPCPDHVEVQHRDGRAPWCDRCKWRHATSGRPACQVAR